MARFENLSVKKFKVDDLTITGNYFKVSTGVMTKVGIWGSSVATGHEIAAVTGTVRIRVLPIVTTSFTAGGAAKISLGTSTTRTNFVAATSVSGLDVGEFWLYASSVSNTKCLNTSLIFDKVVSGDDIGYTITTTATTDGGLDFHIWWEPISLNGKVVKSSGGTMA